MVTVGLAGTTTPAGSVSLAVKVEVVPESVILVRSLRPPAMLFSKALI